MTLPSVAQTEPASTALVTREDFDSVAVLTLNRPHARNSLSTELLTALGDVLDVVGNDRSIRVAILAANGPVFCAGHDLKEMTAHRGDPDHGLAFFKRVFDLCSTV